MLSSFFIFRIVIILNKMNSKSGNLVKLKSGSSTMTVTRYSGRKTVDTEWFNKN